MAISRFEDIEAWQVARDLTQRIYKATTQGQFARDYGLRDQLQRAAVSVTANVVYPVKYVRERLLHGVNPVKYRERGLFHGARV